MERLFPHREARVARTNASMAPCRPRGAGSVIASLRQPLLSMASTATVIGRLDAGPIHDDAGGRELERRLDERDQAGRWGEVQPAERRDRVGDRRVRQVDRHHVDDVRHHVGAERVDVRALEVHDPRIEPQAAEELPEAGVDGVHPAHPGLQQRGGEPAGGRANVDGERHR